MSTSESWSSVLKRVRRARSEECLSVVEFEESLSQFGMQISKYNNDYLLVKCGHQDLSLSDTDKLLIEETRSALRFSLCCFSCHDDIQRNEMQSLSITQYQWHIPLSIMLSQEKGDSKCRIFAAKLFSNLVASNHVTAAKISSTIGLSPSVDEISNALQKKLSQNHEGQIGHWQKSSWVSMLISSARETDREALSGVTAALYNCLVALREENQISFGRSLASDSMLVSTLLRHFISVNVVKHSIEKKEQKKDFDKDNEDGDWDSATDWIFLLLVRLMGLGMLPVMYMSIAGKGALLSPKGDLVLPEQNVLLHCAAHEAQSFMDNAAKHDHDSKNPFGGDVGWECVKTSYEFLTDLFCQYSKGAIGVGCNDSELALSAALSSIDVISISLGVDHPDSTNLRKYLGSNTDLLRTSSNLLGSLVDELTKRAEGLKARDLQLSSEEQQWMVSLVRLMGNLCYQCRTNQDRLRMTIVPSAKASESTSTSTNSDVSRNALHVVLSCSTFATSCFTLREWVVVAIRNILHQNEENQNVVAALDAQDPVQSTALDHAGVRVTMEKSGKISLSTLDEDVES